MFGSADIGVVTDGEGITTVSQIRIDLSYGIIVLDMSSSESQLNISKSIE